MKQNLLLTVTSVLSVVLMSLHLAGDIVLGFENGGAFDLIALPILALWLYAALVLVDRRSGCVILLLLSLLGMAVPYLHMTGKGLGGEVAASSGGFLFIWTTLSLGVTALVSLVLSVRGLFSPRRTTAS